MSAPASGGKQLARQSSKKWRNLLGRKRSGKLSEDAPDGIKPLSPSSDMDEKEADQQNPTSVAFSVPKLIVPDAEERTSRSRGGSEASSRSRGGSEAFKDDRKHRKLFRSPRRKDTEERVPTLPCVSCSSALAAGRWVCSAAANSCLVREAGVVVCCCRFCHDVS